VTRSKNLPLHSPHTHTQTSFGLVLYSAAIVSRSYCQHTTNNNDINTQLLPPNYTDSPLQQTNDSSNIQQYTTHTTQPSPHAHADVTLTSVSSIRPSLNQNNTKSTRVPTHTPPISVHQHQSLSPHTAHTHETFNHAFQTRTLAAASRDSHVAHHRHPQRREPLWNGKSKSNPRFISGACLPSHLPLAHRTRLTLSPLNSGHSSPRPRMLWKTANAWKTSAGVFGIARPSAVHSPTASRHLQTPSSRTRQPPTFLCPICPPAWNPPCRMS